jgi:lysophospholipase L1-like esterase
VTRSLRNLIFGFFTVIVLLLLVEFGLRLAVTVSTNWVKEHQQLTFDFKLWQMHLFDSFMGMHEPDPELFWKMKPNYHSLLVSTNSEGFVGPEIEPKEKGEYRILFLGDSTPLGIGLPNFRESFVFQLQDSLRAAYPDRKITVINASTAGYSSWQCRKLLELDGAKLQPDLVVTYFGNNDPSINGYLSDQQLHDLSASYGGIKRLLSKSYLYRTLKLFILRWRSGSEDQGNLKERVSLPEFRDNIEAIRQWCDLHDCKLALCTVPTPNLWPPGLEFKVFSQGRDQEGRLVMSEQMRAALGGDWALCLDTLLLPGRHDVWTERVYAGAYSDKGDPVVDEQFYENGLERDPDNAQYLNNLGVLRWRQGKESVSLFRRALAIDTLSPVIFYNKGIAEYYSDTAASRLDLARAKELDNYSLRIKKPYNTDILIQSKSPGVTLVDLVQLMRGLPENKYYVDHCHPTLRGHKLIAAKLFETLTPIMSAL